MKIDIRPAEDSDLTDYTKLLQKTYEETYPKTEIGLTSDCFSEEVFNTQSTQDYLKSNLVNNDGQRSWLAFADDKLVGAITIQNKKNEFELRGFYVAPDYQGIGIGKRLWELAKKFAKEKDIVLDIYAHNIKTIETYKRWGFEIDKEKGEFYRHWPEWPENVKVKSIYMRLRRK